MVFNCDRIEENMNDEALSAFRDTEATLRRAVVRVDQLGIGRLSRPALLNQLSESK